MICVIAEGTGAFGAGNAPGEPLRGQKRFYNGARSRGMRAEIEVETLLQIVLVLVVIWLALQIVEATLGVLGALLGPLSGVFGLLIVVLIVLWLLDYI